jgi:hypothetical protein
MGAQNPPANPPPSTTDTPTFETAFHEVRFRGRTADGREVISQSIRLLAADPPPPDLKLGVATFGHARYHPGDTAILSVHGHGADGRDVRFVIEKEDGGKWAVVDEVRGVIERGVAIGRWFIQLPKPEGEGKEGGGPGGGGKEGGDEGKSEQKPVKLRFQAIADFAHTISEPIEVETTQAGDLTNPEWSHAHPEGGSEFDHGDQAIIRIQAKNAEGRTVRFFVEQKRGEEDWKPYATAYALVRNGVAQVPIKMAHPLLPSGAPPPDAKEVSEAQPAQLRFSADYA